MNPSIFVSVTTEPSNPQAARETIRYDQFVRRLLKADTEPMEALHIGLGLAGELGELVEAWKTVDVIEELGDYEFYFQAGLHHYGLEEVRLPVGPKTFPDHDYEQALTIATGEFVDCIKREYIYNKPRDWDAVIKATTRVLAALLEAYKESGIDRATTIQSNATKLEVRYAGLVYSDLAANTRADKATGS